MSFWGHIQPTLDSDMKAIIVSLVRAMKAKIGGPAAVTEVHECTDGPGRKYWKEQSAVCSWRG